MDYTQPIERHDTQIKIISKYAKRLDLKYCNYIKLTYTICFLIGYVLLTFFLHFWLLLSQQKQTNRTSLIEYCLSENGRLSCCLFSYSLNTFIQSEHKTTFQLKIIQNINAAYLQLHTYTNLQKTLTVYFQMSRVIFVVRSSAKCHQAYKWLPHNKGIGV